MQRRSFLGALLGMAAAPVLARLAPAFVEPPKAEAFLEAPSILKPHSLGIIPGSGPLHRISAYTGREELYSAAICNFCRPDGTILLRFTLCGHNLTWTSAPGSELVFLENEPLVMEAPPDVAVILTHSDLDGRNLAATSIKGGQSITTFFDPQSKHR